MVVYKKDGKEFLLMSNTSRGVMKIPTAGFASAAPINSRIGGTAGVPFETIATMTGVVADGPARRAAFDRDRPDRRDPEPAGGRAPLVSRYLIAAAVLVCATACGRPPLLEISIVGAPAPTAIEVSGLPRADLAALAGATLTRDRWQQIFTVSVAGAAGPVVGDYTIVDATVRFTPMYGLDAGRSFDVTFDASRIPGADPGDNWRRPPLKKVVSVAGRALARTTVVEHVYPSGGEVTANMLRFYIEFSAPMGRGSALDHIRLVDDAGQEVVEPFLPVDAELWTPDHTRFTLLFDPGRVKRGIKPNRDLGRALIPGKRYALTIGERLARWPRREAALGPSPRVQRPSADRAAAGCLTMAAGGSASRHPRSSDGDVPLGARLRAAEARAQRPSRSRGTRR